MSPFLFEGPCFGKGVLCEAVLRLLQDWFGIEEAVRQYALDIDRLPTFLVMDGGRASGFLSVKIHNEYSAELYVMGVRPEAHRQGIGHLSPGDKPHGLQRLRLLKGA